MIKAVEAERDRASAAAPDQKAALLVRFTGIGDVSAHVLVDEVFYRDFADRREVASFFGLAASPYSSGSVRRDQGISRAGNPRARRVAIELAWMWLRHQPGSGLSRWFHERVGASRGRFRRVLVVALARKLMVALWRYLATGTVPEGAAMATG
jgi:transposase